MASSGSSDFTLTRDQICTTALELIGKLPSGGTIDSDDLTMLGKLLNLMVKGWQVRGIHVWATEEGALFLTNNQNKYTMSVSTTDKVGKNPVNTSLTADASANTLTVSSTVGMTAADNIGVCLDNNTIQWTTITSVDSATALTIGASVSSTASSGNSVYTYTTAVGRPLSIRAARARSSDGTERPLKLMGHTDYMDLPSKTSTGLANQFHYNPRVSDGYFYVYPTPADVNECITFTYTRSIEDFDASGNTPDFPQEWEEALVYNLAVRAGSAFGIKMSDQFPDIVAIATQSVQDMSFYDIEEGSVRIVPNERYDE